MTRLFPIYFIAALLFASIFSACNDDADTVISESTTYVNCEVSSFSLMRDDSVLVHLDSVYFSIDLMNARIFNADSLPVGTNTSKLKIKVGTESASACNLTYRIPGTDRDTVVNLIEYPNDSVNFSDGPVTMEIVSFNGQARRTYQVSVNVHKIVPDTLYWSELATRPLPGPSGATAQKTVAMGENLICLTSTPSGFYINEITDPYSMDYTSHKVSLPAGAVVESLCATDDALLLTAGGMLYKSADKGSTWASTGQPMDYIYGAYGEMVLGAMYNGSGYSHVAYPTNMLTDVPQGCPVSGTSPMIVYTSKWNIHPMAIVCGGRTADGTLTGDTWAFDGTKWGKVSTTPLPEFEDVAVIPYNTPRVSSSSWRVTKRSALLAMGGKGLKNGSAFVNDSVYVSYDMGITWAKGSAYLQFPKTVAPFSGAQAFVADRTLHADSRGFDDWTDLSTRSLPAWVSPEAAGAPSRAIKPEDEWICPYIYLFGGVEASGRLSDTVRRGVINRYTFKLLY